jgi:hypothetical protein
LSGKPRSVALPVEAAKVCPDGQVLRHHCAGRLRAACLSDVADALADTGRIRRAVKETATATVENRRRQLRDTLLDIGKSTADIEA